MIFFQLLRIHDKREETAALTHKNGTIAWNQPYKDVKAIAATS